MPTSIDGKVSQYTADMLVWVLLDRQGHSGYAYRSGRRRRWMRIEPAFQGVFILQKLYSELEWVEYRWMGYYPRKT